MRLSGLAVAVILLFSSAVFAQHSSSSSGSSGSSSGSSHSSSSGGSSSGSSSGGHSSGGSGSGSGHGSPSFARGGSSGSSRSVSGVPSPRTGSDSASRSTENAKVGTLPSGKTGVQPEKKSFVHHIFHPFRKRESNFARADFRRRVCTKGRCVCPGGQTSGKDGACAASPATATRCGLGGYWNGGGCAELSQFRVNDCSVLYQSMQEQARRMRMAENSRQTGCLIGAQDCGELTARSLDEAGRYGALQQQYQQCRRQQGYRSHYGYSFGASAALSSFGIE
jgi:hypothetical protein